MTPGRELDAQVAEKVMGLKPVWKDFFLDYVHDYDGIENQIPRYSTDIAAALEVVEKLKGIGWCFELKSWGAESPQGPKTLVYLWKEWMGRGSPTIKPMLMKGDGFQVPGDTAPHAICLAALKAVS